MGSCISKKEPTQERKNTGTNDVQKQPQDSIKKTEIFSTFIPPTDSTRDERTQNRTEHKILRVLSSLDSTDSLEPGGSNPTLGIQNFEMSSELQELNYEITTINTSAIQY